MLRYDETVQVKTPFGEVEIVFTREGDDCPCCGKGMNGQFYVATVVGNDSNKWKGCCKRGAGGRAHALGELFHSITKKLSLDLVIEAERL